MYFIKKKSLKILSRLVLVNPVSCLVSWDKCLVTPLLDHVTNYNFHHVKLHFKSNLHCTCVFKKVNLTYWPSCRKVRSFLTTGNSGMMGGCTLWLLRVLRYLAMLRDGSKMSWRSRKSFSYLLGSFSHVLLNRATGARLRPLKST